MNRILREVTDFWKISDFHHIFVRKAQSFGTSADVCPIRNCATTPKGIVSPLKKIPLSQYACGVISIFGEIAGESFSVEFRKRYASIRDRKLFLAKIK
jgi:hypothetical protein